MANLTGKMLVETVSKLIANVTAHIGGRGNAHAVASQDSNGFMSSDDKWRADMNYQYHRGLDGNKTYDIFNLEYGSYVGAASWFTNKPADFPSDGSLILVKVYGWGTSNFAKMIEVTHPTLGRTWIASVYGAGNIRGWVPRVVENITLESGVTGKITSIRTQTPNGVVVELGLSVSFSDFSGVKKLGTISYPISATGIDNRHTLALGLTDSGTYVPVGIRVDNSGAINVFKLSGTPAITKIAGQITLVV